VRFVVRAGRYFEMDFNFKSIREIFVGCPLVRRGVSVILHVQAGSRVHSASYPVGNL
jgi:hypothetical protein